MEPEEEEELSDWGTIQRVLSPSPSHPPHTSQQSAADSKAQAIYKPDPSHPQKTSHHPLVPPR